MRKKLIALLAAVCMMAAPIGVMAEETDYSYLEDMSVKELRALDAAIHKLLGDGDVKEIQEAAVEEETEAEPVLMKEEDFFKDIVDSYNTRSVVSSKYTLAELNSMTYEELVSFYLESCKAEKPFYDKYKNATFDDLNIAYLCNQYISGLKKQYNSETVWEQTKDWDKFYQEFQSGYYNRGYVIVELSDYWELPFGDVSGMREDTANLDSLNEAETRNSQVPHETVKEVQTLLHEIGFKCWNIDGVAGKRTVKAIKRFQEMYGFEVDGMIDDELIEQLKQVKKDKGIGVEEEKQEGIEEAENETEG